MRSPCKGRNRLKDSNVKTGHEIVGGDEAGYERGPRVRKYI